MEKSKKILICCSRLFTRRQKRILWGRSVLICFPKYNGDAMQCINHLRRHNMLYFSLELFKICSYPSRLAFNSTKANLAFPLMYLFYPLATFANHFFIYFQLRKQLKKHKCPSVRPFVRSFVRIL